MMRKALAGLALGIFVVSHDSPAAAAGSLYTTLDLAACEPGAADAKDPLRTGIWHCLGYLDLPVLVVEADLRFFVSYGTNAANEPAAHETLPPFNTIGDTLEWRFDDYGEAVATILRFFADRGDGAAPTQVLVVTRLGPEPGEVCHIAYVNASVNANANELAQQAADLFARNFICGVHTPLWIGDPGAL